MFLRGNLALGAVPFLCVGLFEELVGRGCLFALVSLWLGLPAAWVISVVVFAVALWLVRSQETVEDVSWMKAMIPHHSIAILTSERAHIIDPRVRKLADGTLTPPPREMCGINGLTKHPAKTAAGCESTPGARGHRACSSRARR